MQGVQDDHLLGHCEHGSRQLVQDGTVQAAVDRIQGETSGCKIHDHNYSVYQEVETSILGVKLGVMNL